MKLIGIDLYQHLLGKALRAARGEADEQWTPELNLGVTGALPISWIPEPSVRLTPLCPAEPIGERGGDRCIRQDQRIERIHALLEEWTPQLPPVMHIKSKQATFQEKPFPHKSL